MLASKIARGISWMMAGRLLGNAIGLVSTLVVATLLAPSELGIFALATSMVQIMAAMFELQTSLMLIQMRDPTRDDFDTAFTINLIRGSVVSLAVLIAAWPFSLVFGDARLLPLIAVLSLFPLILSFRNPYFELHAKEVSFAPNTLLEVGTKIGTFVGMLGVAIFHPTYWALASGLVLSAITSTTISFVLAKQVPRFSLKAFRRVFSFSMWLGFASLVNQINQQADRLILGAGFTHALLGAYAMASQVVEQLMNALIQPVNWVVYSGFSKLNNDIHRLRASYMLAHAAIISILLPASAGLLLVVGDAFQIFLGSKWAGAIIFAQFAAVNFFIRVFPGPAWPLVMSLGKTRELFFRTALSVGLRLAIQISSLALFGLKGFLIGGVIAEVFSAVITLAMIKHVSQLKMADLVLNGVRPVLACLLMVFGVIFLRTYVLHDFDLIARFAAEIAGGIFIYAMATYLIWRLAGEPEGQEQFALQKLSQTYSKLVSAGT